MVSFSVQQLEGILSRREVDGYLELQQIAAAPLVLASQGGAEFKTAQLDGDVAVDGSRWRVAYWAPVSGRAAQTTSNTAALAAGFAALLLALLVWLLLRRTGAALRQDQATLLGVVKDMRDGRVRKEYPTGWPSCTIRFN